LVARRNQVVRHRTRIKNEVHAILQAHLISPCPHADLFGRLGRSWLARQELPDDERAAIETFARTRPAHESAAVKPSSSSPRQRRRTRPANSS
jgi:transposase